MPKITRVNLRQLFSKGAKPAQEAFYNLFDSFWHKDDSIDLDAVKGLQTSLDKKLDIAAQDTILGAFNNLKTEVTEIVKTGYQAYLKKGDTIPVGGWKQGLYKLIEFGNYSNLTPAKDKDGNAITITSVDQKINEAFWNGSFWSKYETTIPGTTAKQQFDPTDNVSPSTMKAGSDRWDKINMLIQKKYEVIATFGSCTWVDGQYYNSNGTTGTDPNTFSRSTNYITVIAGDVYGFVNNGVSIIWYNDNNIVVGFSGDGTDGSVRYREWSAPNSATKARVNILTSNKSNFSFLHYSISSPNEIKPNVIKLSDIDGIVALSNEIANYASCIWVSGSYIDPTGKIQSYASFNYNSNYIAIEAGKSYTFKSSGYAIAWYDADKNFISLSGNSSDGVGDRTFTAPPNAKFSRVNQVNESVLSFSLRLIGGVTETVQIPKLQINANQISGLTPTKSLDTQAQSAKIGDVKLFSFNSYPLTGNIITSGDSTIAAYAGGVAVSSLIKCTGTVTDISVPGETIVQQLSRWNSLSTSIKAAANYVFVQIGLNDMGTGSPESTIMQNLKNFFTAIRTASPSAIIVAGEMLPCRQRYINILGEVEGQKAYLKWKIVNASLSTISEVNKIATVHSWLLNDGNDNLKAEFDTGDAIHENTNGRKMIAYSWLISTL